MTLRRGKHAGVYAVREIPAAEAGPVLKKYVAIAGATRSYFKATKDSPVAEFVAEAAVHPVFELTPAGDIPDTGKNQPSRAGDREGQRGRAHRPGMHIISRSDASPPGRDEAYRRPDSEPGPGTPDPARHDVGTQNRAVPAYHSPNLVAGWPKDGGD